MGEEFLSLAKKDKGFADSVSSSQGVIRKGKETREDGE